MRRCADRQLNVDPAHLLLSSWCHDSCSSDPARRSEGGKDLRSASGRIYNVRLLMSPQHRLLPHGSSFPLFLRHETIRKLLGSRTNAKKSKRILYNLIVYLFSLIH